MKALKYLTGLAILCLALSLSAFAQGAGDSVNVTFYYIPDGNPTNVYLPGEFNNWQLNNSTRMTLDPASGVYSRTVKLRIGGPQPLPQPNSIPGAYQYKFHFDGNWISDPRNPRRNPADNDNSYLFIENPTIHYLLPNSTAASGIIRTRFPEISAYLFPALTGSIDTSTISVSIDGTIYSGIGSGYDPTTNFFSFTPPAPLGDGSHTLILSAAGNTGSSHSDTTTFEVQANQVQILTLDAQTLRDTWRLRGAFFDSGGGFDSTISSAMLVRSDSTWMVSVANGRVDTTISLLEGANTFTLQNGADVSEPVVIDRRVNHTPTADISVIDNAGTLELSAAGSSDPDGQNLTYLWREDAGNPEPIGIGGSTGDLFSFATPASPGEYFFELLAEDPDGNIDSTRNYFAIDSLSGDVSIPGLADNVDWVKNTRIYLMFIKAFTPEGTFQAAIPNLEYVKAMGFNVIWILPVMDVDGSIDNQINIGYNIIDFFNVDERYGSNEDFRDFIDAAHSLDLKVLLDVTPNHSGRNHPLAREARLNGNLSPFYNYYVTRNIPHNDNGLGHCMTPEGIYYYCGFSDALLNWDWDDIDARDYMIDVYEHWVREYDIDGFRFDVYWGPHRRHGRANFDVALRERLKDIKPDILLLGEDSGTGVGTEIIYGDRGGGLDVGYDSKLYFNAIRNFPSSSNAVNTLHNELDNGGFYPGPNANYLRFMENQDEDRISYEYDSFEKTMPVASVLFTAPGTPLLYNGQEVGFGRGMGAPGEPDLNDRRRGIIDWGFAGRSLLQPHYQRLGQIRAQFAAFRQHKQDTNNDGVIDASDDPDFRRVTTGNGLVYSFLRPFEDQNGLTVTNFANADRSVTLDLTTAGLLFDGGFNTGDTYWVNNLYSDTSYQVLGADLANFTVDLPVYGSAVYTISATRDEVILPLLPDITAIDDPAPHLARQFELLQNYPNPFNPATVIRYSLSVNRPVSLKVYDLLGREVKTLVRKVQAPGNFTVNWDGRDDNGRQVSSGIYYYRLQAGNLSETRKMLLLR